jgi:glycosyltransferase involved in cell wall biosynthesis
MRPEISIIVPVYNVEKFLMRCVESLRNQILQELEIILVDDGSTDESGKICDDLERKDQRIRVIHKQNEGQGIARNSGIEIAEGKYAAFVDADDYIEAETYQYVVSQMEDCKADVGCFGYTHDNSEGNSIYQSKIKDSIYFEEKVKKEFALHFFGDDPMEDDMRGVSACMSVYRMELIKKHKIRFPSERKVLSEDTLFNLEFCRFAETAVSCSRVFYHYCLQQNSFSRGYSKERLGKTAEFMVILSGYAEEFGIKEQTKNRIKMVLWISLLDAVKQEVNYAKRCEYWRLRASIKEICTREYVLKLLKTFSVKGLNKKQKIFFFCMKYKQYFCLIMLSYLRNRQGLQS